MGTFHDGLGELHGVTVIVDTNGPKVYIGRCEVYLEDRHILLNESDEFEETAEMSKDDYVKRAAQIGFWKKHDRILVKAEEISSVRPLNAV